MAFALSLTEQMATARCKNKMCRTGAAGCAMVLRTMVLFKDWIFAMSTVSSSHSQINDALILEATRLLAKSLPPAQKIVGVLRLLSEWAQLPYGRVLVPNYSTHM